MPGRPAQFTQADVARVIRAAKQAGAVEVKIKIGDDAWASILLLSPDKPVAESAEIVL
jgi:hypothetical protein